MGNVVANLATVATAAICVAVLVYAAVRRSKVPPALETRKPAEQQRAKAIDMRLDLSEKLFDMALALLAVLWGLVLAEKVRLDVRHAREAVLFTSTNALIVISLLFHLLYRRRLSALLWDLAPEQPDIFSEHVDYLLKVQSTTFFAGLFAVAVTLISTRVMGGP
jgi:hypothetical protein